MTDIEAQKTGYSELIELCVGDSRRNELTQFVNELKDYNGDEDYLTTLNFVKNYLDGNGIHFIMALDWKQEIKDLAWRVRSALRDNFNVEVELPDPNAYGQYASVSSKNVFKDYDQAVRVKGLKIGFLDTGSDEYVIVVHPVDDEIRVTNAIEKIGYKYLDVNSIKIDNEV